MSNVSRGYAVPAESTVKVRRLEFRNGGNIYGLNNSEEIDLDLSEPFIASIHLDVNYAEFLATAGFKPHEDVSFSVALTWSVAKTRQRGSSHRQRLVDGINVLEAEIPGEFIAGAVSVHAMIVLEQSNAHNDWRALATRPGSIMWESKPYRLQLEGTGAEFSITTVDFEQQNIYPKSAMWKIILASDLNAPIESGIRVLLNSGHSRTEKMLSKQNTMESKLWHQMLEYEVIIQMVLHACKFSDELLEIEDPEEGSVAETLTNLIGSFFPDHSIDRLKNDLPLIFATVQSKVFESK